METKNSGNPMSVCDTSSPSPRIESRKGSVANEGDDAFTRTPEDKELRQMMLERYKTYVIKSSDDESKGEPTRTSTAPAKTLHNTSRGEGHKDHFPTQPIEPNGNVNDGIEQSNNRESSAVSRARLTSSKLMIDRQSQTPDIFLTNLPPTRPATSATDDKRPWTGQSQLAAEHTPTEFTPIDEENSVFQISDDETETGARNSVALINYFDDFKFDSDEYDTDLEEQETPLDPDVKGEKLYLKLCEALNIIPASYFLRNIESEIFNMQYRCIGSKGARAMASPLAMNTHITKCNLSANMLDADGAKYFAAMLNYNCYITEIDLSCNNIGSEGAEHIYRAFYNNTTVRKVNLSDNRFKDRDATHFAEILEQNISLREIRLSKNEFSSHAGCILGPAIASNDTLDVLDLSWNHLRLQGALEIAKGLAVNVRLKKLDLHMNGLADAGARMIGQALILNSTLEELDLDNNRISTGAAIDLSESLTKNTTLVKLKLGNNPVLSDGAIALVNAIVDNNESAMEYLDLTGYLVMEDFMEVVDEIKERQKFDVKVGTVTKGKKLEENIFIFNDSNPLEILLIFMSEKNLRLMDLFKSLDKDQSMSLTREEFITGLQEVNTPLTVAQYDELMDMLDKDGDGEIDLAEILNINKEFKEVKYAARKKYDEQIEMEKQAKKKNAKKGRTAKAATVASVAETASFKSAISALMDKVKKKKEAPPDEPPAEKTPEEKKLVGMGAIKKWKKLVE